MIATSGLVSRIHSWDFSNPENTRFQYGSSVLPLSMAAPMAGTCDEPTPAMILATAHFRFADFDLDFGFDATLPLAFAFATFLTPAALLGAAPAIKAAGVFLPERERLPSTERPPSSIILA